MLSAVFCLSLDYYSRRMSHKLTKIKTTNPKRDLSFLSVGYRKDVFMFFVDRVELSEFLMKSFALLTMKSKPTVLMKFSATQKMKLNPPIAAAISYCEAMFHPPARVDLVEKDRFLTKSVLFWRAKRDLNPRPSA